MGGGAWLPSVMTAVARPALAHPHHTTATTLILTPTLTLTLTTSLTLSLNHHHHPDPPEPHPPIPYPLPPSSPHCLLTPGWIRCGTAWWWAASMRASPSWAQWACRAPTTQTRMWPPVSAGGLEAGGWWLGAATVHVVGCQCWRQEPSRPLVEGQGSAARWQFE